jgi:hypothetical protein
MIRAITMAYELGFKDVQDYYDTPGTWITFDFDNHPEMQVGIMTFTNGRIVIEGQGKRISNFTVFIFLRNFRA